MGSIGITTYAIGIQDKTTNQDYLLNGIEGAGFIELFGNFINTNCCSYENNERLEKVFKFEDHKSKAHSERKAPIFDFIIGKVKTGSYGYEAEIIDTNTGGINYNKNTDDAEVMPFYFFIAIPSGDANRGIVILQSNGIFGIKTIFQETLSGYLKDVNPNYRLILGNVAHREYIERYFTEGVLQKIRFFRYDIPHDVSNKIGFNNGVKESYEEYIINKPIGFLRNNGAKIKECIRGQRCVNNIIRLDNFEYNNIKLDFKLGRKHKTINLSNIDNLSLSEDITDEVDLIGGHPTFESIESIMIDTAIGYLEEMGLIIRR